MAKQCIYCGQPLPKDDARFCNDCGQSQIVPSSVDAEQASIKVKLPPREFARDDLSAAPKTSFPSERGVAPARPLQTPPSSRVPKRPVRLASQERQARGERPEISSTAESVNPKSPSTQMQQPDSAPAHISQTTFEESTMVRPGWQEELELLRKDRTSSLPEKKALPEPNPTPWRPQNVPPSMLAQERTPSGADHASFGSKSEERTRVGEQPQRELHVKVWDQQSSPSPSAPSVRTSGSESAFSSVSEERDEDLADLETAMWQQVDNPATESKNSQEMIDENATTLWEEDFSQDKVEDFPTAVLDVPPVVQSQPHLPIERTSTPPSQGSSPVRATGKSMDVEDQLTRPMPASFAPSRPLTPQPSPRSPLPPVPPRFADLPPLENRPARPVSNPISSPSSYGQSSGFGQPGSAGREPHAMNPPSIVPNPASQAGNSARWSEGQTARSFASMTPPNTPQPDSGYVAAAFGPPRQKRHLGRVWVVLFLLLLVGGGAFWYVQYQPFTNHLSQTDQIYQNTTLGFSVHYPLYWKVSDNQARSIVRFMDSTATGQVSLSRADASGSLALYLSQQEAQLGLTGQKAGSAVTFAGATWQQVQGNVNLGGATYTITLYATQHNGHFYTLACLTVPNVYAQMERSDFAPLRASFHFL